MVVIDLKDKFKSLPNKHLLAYFIFSIIFMETILRLSSVKGFFSPSLIFSTIFGIAFSLIFYLLGSLFEEKTNLIVSSIILFLLSFVYGSQIVYYKVFKTFYTTYSLTNSGQALEFWSETLNAMKNTILALILIFIPFIVFIYKRKFFKNIKKVDYKYGAIILAFGLLIHFVGIIGLYLGPKDENSPYSLYYKIEYPDFSISNLGLLTYSRLNVQRYLTKWEPEYEEEIVLDDLPGLDDEKNPNTGDNPPDPEEKEVEKVTEYNVMDIDFDRLIENESDQDMVNMHTYFKNLSPTEKNDYTGLYEGYNLILLTAEGFSHLAVNKEVTPTLYRLVHEGYNFTNFYTPIWGVSTSDGEYVANTGLIPKSGVWSFKTSGDNYMPFAMGNQLRSLGYATRAYHNHTYTYYGRDKSHPNMGYDYKGVGNGLNVKATWPESDLEMMEVTIGDYIHDQPFHTYYMTVSGHLIYNFVDNYMSYKNKDLVEDLDYSLPSRAYLAAQIELDRALEYLLDQLEKNNLAEKTLIALSADHYPYGLDHKEIEELSGKSVDDNFELYRNAFILYTKGMEPQVIDKPASSLDIIPTLSNLMGLEYDSRLLMGSDIFSNAKPLVIFSNRSFITDRGSYNSKTKVYSPNEGFPDDEDYRKAISSIINNKFTYSAKILDKDYYSRVLQNK